MADDQDQSVTDSGPSASGDWVQTTRQDKGDDVQDAGLRRASVEAREDVNARLHSGEVYDGETFETGTSGDAEGAGRTAFDDAALTRNPSDRDPAGAPDQEPVAPSQSSPSVTGGSTADATSDAARAAPQPADRATFDAASETADAATVGNEAPTQSPINTPAFSPRAGGAPSGSTAEADVQSPASASDTPPAEIPLDLNPTRPDMPLDVAQPGETVTLNIRLGGEAYRGDPAYEILVDGEIVAQGVVDWARETTTDGKYTSFDEVEWRDIGIDLQMPSGGFGNVEVRFPNDAYSRDVGDRNLLVDKITIDDVVYEAEADATVYHGGKFEDGASQERMPWRGTLEFDVSDMADHAQQLPAPEGAYVIENEEGASVGTLDLTEAQLDELSLTVSDDRFEIIGNEIKLKDGISLDYEDVQSLSLEVTATEGPTTSTAVFEIAVADVPEPVYTVVEGSVEGAFTARYFDVDHSIRELADIDWGVAPTHEESVAAIDYENGRGSFWEDGAKDTFGVQITGQIDVPESGTFNFTLGGDDGVMLFIDGQPVIDNDGLHSYKSETVEVDLEPGPHAIEVIYFENYGHAGLKLEWDGPGLDGPQLVGPMDMEAAQSFEGVALSLEVDLPRADELVSVQLDGLPEGFTLTEGSNVAVSGVEPVSLDGWDLSNLQITPPVGFTGEVNAMIEGSDGGLLKSTAPISFEVVDSDTVLMPPLLETGFRVEFFEEDSSLRRLEDVDFDATPAETGVFETVDFTNSGESFWQGGATDHFAARVTGDIEIGEGGLYDFRLASDDGAKLFINGEEVIDNDGLHGFRNRDGEIELDAGIHEIEILYFENQGRAGLRFEYGGPDTDGEMGLVPAVSAPATDGTQPAELALNLESLTDVGSVTFADLPPGTWLSDGENSLLVSDGIADVTDWDHGLLQVTPPDGMTEDFVADITVEGTGFNGAAVTREVSIPIDVVVPQDSDGAVDQSLWDQGQEDPSLGSGGADSEEVHLVADMFNDQQNEDDISGDYAYG